MSFEVSVAPASLKRIHADDSSTAPSVSVEQFADLGHALPRHDHVGMPAALLGRSISSRASR
jgi:hypothetical protein